MPNLVSCEDCGHQISARATACPNCGCPVQAQADNPAAVEPSAPAQQAEQKPQPEIDPQTQKAANIGCLVIIFVVAFFVFAGVGGGSSSKDWRTEDDSIGAYVMMQTFVERRLKSPATADFPRYSKSRVTRTVGQTYRVSSYVDSENGFGANIRTNFTGRITRTGPDKWKLDSLEFHN